MSPRERRQAKKEVKIDMDYARRSRFLRITVASCLGNTLFGVGKLVLGLISASVFTCVSALYTFCMVAAKCVALAGIIGAKPRHDRLSAYKIAGGILIAASIFYIIYSTRLLTSPSSNSYDIYTAITIAAFTFGELVLNIRGVIVERRSQTMLVHAVRMINLASALLCLVLTQSALLSISSASSAQSLSVTNGIFGIGMGGLAMVLGIAMIARTKIIESRGSIEESEVHQ